MRLKPLCVSIIAVNFGLFLTPLIVSAKPSDPLQNYRDEIKQAENKASQTLLDQLDPDMDSNTANPYLSTSPPQTATNPSPSNTQRAFSPPPSSANPSKPNTLPSPSANKNPWLKPNPWEAQSKVNPWANAPIPGPGPAIPPSSFTPMSPPNIFAPPQATTKPNTQTTNSNTSH
jgi:hypothetical protein